MNDTGKPEGDAVAPIETRSNLLLFCSSGRLRRTSVQAARTLPATTDHESPVHTSDDTQLSAKAPQRHRERMHLVEPAGS